MNDKELDDFFRDQSEHPDIPYRDEDWEKLREKLDKAPSSPGINGSGSGSKGWWIALLALAILTGAGLGWKYWGYEDSRADTEAASNGITVNGDLEEQKNETNGRGEIDKFPATVGSLAKAPAPTPDPATGSVTRPSETDIIRNEKETSEKATISSSGFSNLKHISTTQKSYPIPLMASSRFAPLLSMNVLPDSMDQRFRVSMEESQTKKTPVSQSNSDRGSRFHTTLTLAPDVSALKIKDIQGLGNSVGLNFEYFFHHNISINLGAMYVFKTYQAGEGYSTGYVPAPSYVDGTCWVLDLPLNVRYYAINQKLSRWYVSAGLSSYLMLKEKYEMKYRSYDYGGSAYANQLEVKNKNSHYLHIANFGIGYERVLSDKLSLQVEPYLKLPFKGIGEGDIALKSAGAFVGLKYGW